jgi:hypothetical protein
MPSKKISTKNNHPSAATSSHFGHSAHKALTSAGKGQKEEKASSDTFVHPVSHRAAAAIEKAVTINSIDGMTHDAIIIIANDSIFIPPVNL